MKKFLSIILLLTIVLSLGITAFADGETGTITVTNATKEREYKAYKIFGATISTDDNGKTAVSYIAAGSKYFDKIFTDDTYTNSFFVYNENTGTVTKKEGVNDSELIDYLTELVKNSGYAADKIQVADSDEVRFEDMPYGYYLITSSLGSTVTINSNTPNVSVIDKNQKPGSGFDKLIQNGVDADGNPVWSKSNSANIGDEITYKISFEATNYDGDKKIKYYQIHDEKGDAIWAEFDSFKVVVDDKELPRGYYLDHAKMNNGDWEFLNENSNHIDSWKNFNGEKNRNNAQWYLVHLGEDEFRITIPWLENHKLEDVTNTANEVVSHSLKFDENEDSKFSSPVDVEITYKAVVEADAVIGNTTHGNRFNKAYTSWTSEHETGYTTPKEVVTYVYGIGLLKDDIATSVNLAGAEFRVYRDKGCTVPVYLLPTKIDGVYIVDSLNTPLNNVSGTGKETTRDLCTDEDLVNYLKDAEGKPVLQNNLVVSQINGKLVILGLKEGTYYLKEVKAPSGYNALTQPIEFIAGDDIRPFSIFADVDGNVADIQEEDGIHTENRYDLTHTVVHNSKGVVLPSTGGMGTFWLITIGTILAIGFAVFLITHKKMSVYTD